MSYLKHILFLFFVVLVLCGCVSGVNRKSEKYPDRVKMDLEQIRKRGKLVVLTENSLASFFIYKGKKLGFEYEMLTEFARHLGVQLEIRVIENKDEMISMLKEGVGDILACNLTVTRQRKELVAFSLPFLKTKQVLVQRSDQLSDSINKQKSSGLIRELGQLARKKVHVWKNSSYFQRLIHIQEEIGDTIYVIPQGGENGVEELIEKVSEGTIDYTVVEDNIAWINCYFYPNLDVSTKLSFDQNMAFALRKSSPTLMKELNQWLVKFKRTERFAAIKRSYFFMPSLRFKPEEFLTHSRKGQLSDYDNIFKEAAANYKMNWLFLAAISFQESKFNPKARGLGGAFGLMQFMPSTGRKYGVNSSSSPLEQVMAAGKMIQKNKEYWSEIKDSTQREKFILASYNAGSNHIQDARKLARKYGLNAFIWDKNVDVMVRNLSKSQYYRDPVVRFGSMRGPFTCNYVRKIHGLYTEWNAVYGDTNLQKQHTKKRNAH